MKQPTSKFVSPFEPVEIQTPKRPPTAPTLTEIVAQWVQNFGGAVGIGAGVACLLWLFGRDAGGILKWSLASGVLTWAALMAVRSIVDELVDYDAWRKMQNELDAMAEERDEAMDVLEQERAAHSETKRALMVARGEVEQLMRQVSPNYRPAQSLEAGPRQDAQRILEWYFDYGEWPARERVAKPRWGWEQRRFDDALELLRNAGVVTQNHRSVRVAVPDLAAAMELLGRYTHNYADAETA